MTINQELPQAQTYGLFWPERKEMQPEIICNNLLEQALHFECENSENELSQKGWVMASVQCQLCGLCNKK